MKILQSNLLRSVVALAICILFFRIGSHTPIPFINKAVFDTLFQSNQSGILQLLNVMGGGSLSRMSVFSLSIMPYITASIIIFVAQLTSIKVKEMASTEIGKVKIERIKRFLTIFIVLSQSMTLATILLSQSVEGEPLATITGVPFYISTFLSLLTGTFIVIWLANIITFVGLGAGTSLIIMFGILTSVPSTVSTVAGMLESGATTVVSLVALISLVLVSFIVVVYFENGERRIATLKSDKYGSARPSYVTFKSNPIGMMPPIFALIAISGLVTSAGFLSRFFPTELVEIKNRLSGGTIEYIALFALLTFAFGILLRRTMLDAKRVSNGILTSGQTIRGLRVGGDTERYLRRLFQALTTIACFYLVFLCTIPEVANISIGIPLYIGGTSILIMVATASEMRKNIFGMLEGDAYKKIAPEFLK